LNDAASAASEAAAERSDKIGGNVAIFPNSLIRYPRSLIEQPVSCTPIFSETHEVFQETPLLSETRAELPDAQYPGIFSAKPLPITVSSRLYCALQLIFPVADVPLIHHHNPCGFGN
jgi:hypothetical protein